jgi:M6 family metalloprotease-like protein
MISEALRSFDDNHDFSQYDNNGDGFIDGLNVLYSGQSGGWSSFWWAYQWSFYVPDAQTTLFDGKRLGTFTWQRLDPRADDTDFDPQTLIHETGHLLGLPDLYDYKEE